mmetsp:Transcript_16362/g.36270  ORF Transcript_16362/g.36270 Transcript_16362/m.36270 type:complete len:249 (+) Transcript_16362:62-808(+)
MASKVAAVALGAAAWYACPTIKVDLRAVAAVAAASSVLVLSAVLRKPYGEVVPDRVTAKLDKKEFVVFIIGASVNRPQELILGLFNKARRDRLWSLAQMPEMVAELYRNPASGFLHAEMYTDVPAALFGRPTLMVQYWQSKEQLMEYSRAKDNKHYPAWLAFNKAARQLNDDGAFGIYHETYVVSNSESIYRFMPPFGLRVAAKRLAEMEGKAEDTAITGATASAWDRLGVEDKAKATMEGFSDYRSQ